MTTKKGNALLIALLLMSILSLITVGLSRLVTSETRQIRDLLRNNQAEYLAQAGTELAQLIFYQTEPGNEAYFDGQYELELSDADADPKTIKFAITRATNHVPVRPLELYKQANQLRVQDATLSQLFQPLLPGDSVEIPLADGTQDFEVEYYISTITTYLGEFTQADLDVLLFRLSGVANTEPEQGSFKINFITQYFPAGAPGNSHHNNIGKSAQSPAKICTAVTDCFNGGDFFTYSSGDDSEVSLRATENESLDFLDIALPRPGETSLKSFQSFLSEHKNNIITMTNAINLEQISAANPNITLSEPQYAQLQEALGSIHYRVCSPTCADAISQPTAAERPPRKPLTSPIALIESTGVYRQAQKNTLTELSNISALSVFDFAIYQTN